MTKRAGTNGSVSIRATRPDDAACLLAGRDIESKRFLGEGDLDPHPAFCIEVFGQVVGWVDFDIDRTWLQPGEVNIGYNVFPAHRGYGFAAVAVRLLFDHLHEDTDFTVATLLIDQRNERSMAVAERLGCERQPDFDGNAYFKLVLNN